MAVTRGTSTAAGSHPTNAPTPMEASSTPPPPTASSLFGDGPAKTGNDAPTSLKRKITDVNLEVITIDVMYDLTLIVGTPEHAKGQKAFRVNKGSFRNVSIVWSKMTSGDWAESKQSEISFPDDSCEAFLIVLRIAHFQVSQLPDALSRDELYELAVFTDKYELQNAVRMGVELKKWLEPYRQSGVLRPALRDLAHFVFIIDAFGIWEDYDRLLDRIAVETLVDESGDYYYLDEDKNKVTLRSTLPSRATEELGSISSDILTHWIACCSAAMNSAITTPETPCKRPQCAMSKIGILMTELQAAGFYPVPSSPEAMHESIMFYWSKIKNLGASHKPWFPNGTRYSYGSTCSFKVCLGDFGIINEARGHFKQGIMLDNWKQWVAEKVV